MDEQKLLQEIADLKTRIEQLERRERRFEFSSIFNILSFPFAKKSFRQDTPIPFKADEWVMSFALEIKRDVDGALYQYGRAHKEAKSGFHSTGEGVFKKGRNILLSAQNKINETLSKTDDFGVSSESHEVLLGVSFGLALMLHDHDQISRHYGLSTFSPANMHGLKLIIPHFDSQVGPLIWYLKWIIESESMVGSYTPSDTYRGTIPLLAHIYPEAVPPEISSQLASKLSTSVWDSLKPHVKAGVVARESSILDGEAKPALPSTAAPRRRI